MQICYNTVEIQLESCTAYFKELKYKSVVIRSDVAIHPLYPNCTMDILEDFDKLITSCSSSCSTTFELHTLFITFALLTALLI